ncbi:hypothetical protein [Georgenia sp. SUBG003]|uniref:hypothetical protein n=1 Tax=Georgenia sp. SUBG003 TaxID=1497974 RepID=UPI003AB3B965
MGVWKVKGESTIALKDFRDDPVANPLPTPSGRIEIFSEPLWEMSKTWELPRATASPALPRPPENVNPSLMPMALTSASDVPVSTAWMTYSGNAT